MKLLLEAEDFSDILRKTFLVYLISHNRPIAELLAPIRRDIRGAYEGDFRDMTAEPITLSILEETREVLVHTINSDLTDDERKFLLSFKRCKPEWQLLGLEGIDRLPAVKWKLANLAQMPPEKHRKALIELEKVLENGTRDF